MNDEGDEGGGGAEGGSRNEEANDEGGSRNEEATEPPSFILPTHKIL